MKIDLSKYLKNKDVQITNEDFDLDAMEKEIYKGYTKNSDIEKPDYSGYVKKEDFALSVAVFALLLTLSNENRQNSKNNV